jgi:hypothetical protein
VDRALTRLNPSRIAIGALIPLLTVYFLSVVPASADPVLDSLREALGALTSLPILWLGVIVLIVAIVFALLTSIRPIRWLANVVLGFSLFLFAYRFEDFRNLYLDGRIIFVLFFLLIVATLMNRPVTYET